MTEVLANILVGLTCPPASTQHKAAHWYRMQTGKENKIEKRGEGKHEKRRAGIYLQKKRRLYTAWVYLRTAVSMGVWKTCPKSKCQLLGINLILKKKNNLISHNTHPFLSFDTFLTDYIAVFTNNNDTINK